MQGRLSRMKTLVHQRLLILRSNQGRQHICNNINVSLEKYTNNHDDKDDHLEITQMGVKTTRTASLLLE